MVDAYKGLQLHIGLRKILRHFGAVGGDSNAPSVKVPIQRDDGCGGNIKVL